MRTEAENVRPVGAIVLAAGGSARMGQPKQLLPIDGQPMARQVTETVCEVGLAQVVVVVGAQAKAVTQALDGLPVEIVVNEDWAAGLSGSVRAGLGALRPEVQAALLILADQPALTPDLLRILAARYRATRALIVAPFFQGQRGNPVLFDRMLFSELLAVEGDQGGRAVITRHRDWVESVEVVQAAVLLDVDTQQDYERARAANWRDQGDMTRREHLLRTLRHLIVDMDGVLYRGSQAIPGVGSFVAFLRQRDIPFVLATNNSTQTPQQYVDKLAGMGVTVHVSEILTSSQATAGYLTSSALPGARVFVVGQDGLRTSLGDAGFVLVEDGAEFVVVGMDPTACYERLAQASLLIRDGAQFVGTNPDPTFPSERGIVPGAGSLLAFLETATGVAPKIVGKPGRAMMEQALASMDAESSTTAILGDRLETDILAGQRTGLHTLLVLSGVTDRAMLARSEIQPDLVFHDVGHLHTSWQEVVDG